MLSEAAERVYREATRLFGEKSYPAVTMREISEAVGILPGSLYSHISSKEAILLAIVEGGIDKYSEALAPVAASSDPPDVRMRAAIKGFVQVAADNLEQTSVALHQWKYLDEANRRRVIRKRISYEEMFTKIVDDGIRAGVFGGVRSGRIAMMAIMGMLNWVPEWFSPAGRSGPEEVGDVLADIVLSGLMGRQHESAPGALTSAADK